MSRPFRGSGNFCIQCDRSLQDPFLFCSIACKVNYIESAKPGGKKLGPSNELLPIFYKTRTDVSFGELEEDPQMTPGNGGSAVNCEPLSLVCATDELVKKNKAKKRSCVLMPQAESISRRKANAVTVVIKEMLQRDWSVSVVYAGRDANKVADWLVSNMREQELGEIFLAEPPDGVKELLEVDLQMHASRQPLGIG
ncbi:hypothetical protein V6N13_141947 [Hibiscus sabdariffa]